MINLKIATLFLLFLSLNCFSAGLEEQRKYVFPQTSESFKDFIKNGEHHGLKLHGHSLFEYFDIYLDSEGMKLFETGLSLRLRKRVYPDGTFEYGMQLKSEMQDHGDVRMEIEEDELNFYKIVHQGRVYFLQDILEEMFSHFERTTTAEPDARLAHDAYLFDRIEILKSWVNFKIQSSIAPFQKLVRTSIALSELKSIRPVLIGKSIRSRSHIYIDRLETLPELQDFPASIKEQFDTPDYLKGNDKVWLLESSFDNAVFYPLFIDADHFTIREYEVENKYDPQESSKTLFDQFESGIIELFGAVINIDSKYRQSILYYINRQ